MYTSFSIEIKEREVVLLNLSATEFCSLKNYYKNYKKGMCSAPADFLAQLAVFAGIEEIEISLKQISNVTGYLSRQCYEHLAKCKIAGLIERVPTKIKNNYATKIHIPKFILPCSNGVEQYIFEVVQLAYCYNLLLTPEFVISLTARSRFVGESFVFESLQQSVDNLIKSNKLYCDTALLPKVLHDAYLKNNCITISSLNKKYSNLNEDQSKFLAWINRTCGFYLYESLHQGQGQGQGQGVISQFILYHPKSIHNHKTEATL